jgi:uncharacterized protein YjbI with pentapeptide repeats
MADEEQLRILEQGVQAWNRWRRPRKSTAVDLRGANLDAADLEGVDFHGADLREAKLGEVNFDRADLREADLSEADLGEAFLIETDLAEANLERADLSNANLSWTNLTAVRLAGADLSETNFSDATLSETDFLNLDLSSCRGLETCIHLSPSSVDIRTLQRSGHLPLAFLRGVGLPDVLIEYLPSLLGQAIQHYSCFISYSSKDDRFARRLHADLQDKGVRCWFAPHDMKIGAKILDTLDEAIRLRDKVLLVLSGASIGSDWVEDEVTRALEEERQRGGVVLFPVRVDDAVLTTKQAWAAKLRANRHIGDFRRWKDHDAYQTALQRVLRDLRVEST